MNRKLLIILIAIFALNTKAQIITTVAGNGTFGYNGDGGQATAAELWGPTGIAFDAAGNLYIADYWNNRIRKVNTAEIISTIAGDSLSAYSGDGGQATAAELDSPYGVTIDADNNIYIADEGNNRVRIINTAGIITTIAGNGIQGFSGDFGQATDAELNEPTGMTVDNIGNLYIVDYGNNVIRKVNTSGIITTIAGGGSGGLGDGGQATAAELSNPIGVTIDIEGNFYIADANNQRIRKVNTSGIISTIAGNGFGAGTGSGGFSGDGGQATAAELSNPTDITFDAIGNLYIADLVNYRIRKVNTMGIINTIVGNGIQGFSGDGGQATSAELYSPHSIAFDSFGNLFVADATNNRIRKINNIGVSGIVEIASGNEQTVIYPNPSNGVFIIEAKYTIGHFTLCNINGNEILNQTINEKAIIDASYLNSGIYNLSIISNKDEKVENKRVIILN